MSTLRDVARAAGVSLATASCVINRTKFVSPELTERVETAVRELRYEPNSLARGLRTNRTFTLGLMVSDINNLFFPDIARGVEDRAERENYSVFLCNTDADPKREARYVRTLCSKKVDGIVFTSIRQNDETVRKLYEEGFPIVLINRRLDGTVIDYVGTDNLRGAARAVEYLISLGHTRIGFIGGAALSTASSERKEGFLRTMTRYGLAMDPALVQDGDLKQESGYSAAKAMLSLAKPPTAIFCANDLMAFGAMEAAYELDRHVPGDLSLVGFDDSRIAALPGVQLTTIRQPGYQMGQLAAEILLAKVRDGQDRFITPKQIVLPCELVVRRTTAPPRDRKG